MDYHHNSSNTMAAWFPWWEYKPKDPTYRQLDSHPDRNRRHTHHLKAHRDAVNSLIIDFSIRSFEADDDIILLNRMTDLHPVLKPSGPRSFVKVILGLH